VKNKNQMAVADGYSQLVTIHCLSPTVGGCSVFVK